MMTHREIFPRAKVIDMPKKEILYTMLLPLKLPNLGHKF
jgi:uncharacterized protein YceK